MRPSPLLVPVVFVSVSMGARVADARCPDARVDRACEPEAAMLRPGAIGVVYVPRSAEIGRFVGGGASVAFVDWSIPRDTPGPGVGKIAADFALLVGSEPSASSAIAWRVGPALSFERNPERAFLIPFWAARFGGLAIRDRGHRLVVDGALGLILVRTGAFAIDLGGGWALPLSDPGTFGGPQAQLGISAFGL